MTGFIAYCPDLDLFHYFIDGVIDEKFNSEQAELTIAAHLSSNHDRDAEFMASLIVIAKASPHQKVSITNEGGNGETPKDAG
jgi:hypothetical protein